MSQSNQVQNPYANRYESISNPEDTGVSGSDYDQFDRGQDSVQAAEDPYGMDDLQRIQDGQGNRPSDAEIFSEIDPNFFEDDTSSESDFNGTQALKNLADKIQKTQTLSEEEKTSLLEELAELQQQYLEGSIDNIDLEYEVEALQDKLGTVKDEAKANQKLAVDELKKKIENLGKNELKNHRLSEDSVDTFQSEIETLNGLLNNQNPDLEVIEGRISDLKKDITKTIKTDELKEGITTASSHIPKTGLYWRVTQELSAKIDSAIESGNWSEVRSFLVEHQNEGESNNKRRKRFERRIERRMDRRGEDKNFRDSLEWEFSHKAVQQYVGTLLHKVAEGDGTKLDALLSMIPKDVINTMIGSLEYAKHDLNDTQFAKDDADKQINGYFGTAAETADRLREHLEWNPEAYYDGDSQLNLEDVNFEASETSAA